MKLTRSTTVMLAVCVLLVLGSLFLNDPSNPAGAVEKKSVPVLVAWDGAVKMEARKDAPKSGYIADAEAWAKLWKAWRGSEALPRIDFKEVIVLVAANSDPNRITAIPELDAVGDLKVGFQTTEIAFTNPTEFAYQFALIRREGVKTIDGKAVGKR